MIDTTTGNERNLKNIRQIGTPSEEDKIYIENAAYQRVHEQEYAPRRVFVFMGHTECEDGRYTTFIEAAIPVREIEFSQNIPKWDNRAWSDIFREIKRAYEDAIIVGWALDIKGFVPRMSRELEEVHREQFGGAHQMLLLLDSLEGEEYFYINKGSRLQKRDGFYIYFCPQPKDAFADVSLEIPQARRRRQERYREMAYAQQEEYRQQPHRAQRRRENVRRDRPEWESAPREREYGRENVRRNRPEWEKTPQEPPRGGRRASSYAMAAAIVLLVGMVGVGVYQDRIQLPGVRDVIATMSSGLKGNKKDDEAQVLVGTELTEETDDTQSTQTTDTLNLIPVQELPSGEINKTEGTTESAAGEAEKTGGKDQAEGASGSGGKNGDAQSDEQDREGGEDREENDNPEEDKEDKEGKGDGKQDVSETAAEPEEYYIVQRGDTLTAICNSIYGSPEKLEQIVALNELEDANDIRVGQKLLLP